MSPTVFREGGIRVFFFSREESRMHVHVQSAQGEAKFWMEPQIEIQANYGLADHEIARIREVIERRQDEIRRAWRTHFSG
jgi:hypothetical protein